MKHTRLLMGILCVLLVLPIAAQEQARVRIGYFAFDPMDYDTYINGQRASFSEAWPTSGLGTLNPWVPFIHQAYVTPYLDAAGTRITIAIVPKGEPPESRIMGPVSLELVPGHAYSFAFVGRVEDNNLDLVMIDETEALKGVDLENNYLNILVHNITGAPPLVLEVNGVMHVDSLAYGRASVEAWPFEWALLRVTTQEAQPQTLFDWQGFGEYRVSSLAALTGSYADKTFFWDINERYPGVITRDIGDPVIFGTPIEGQVIAATHRTVHALNLGGDCVVNMDVTAAGPRTADSVYYGVEGLENFDPVVYVYDAAGQLLYWNDEKSLEDDADANFNPQLVSIALKAGSYTVEVGGYADLAAGPYKLTVERLASCCTPSGG